MSTFTPGPSSSSGDAGATGAPWPGISTVLEVAPPKEGISTVLEVAPPKEGISTVLEVGPPKEGISTVLAEVGIPIPGGKETVEAGCTRLGPGAGKPPRPMEAGSPRRFPSTSGF
jgi:hypothetical protein